MAETNRRRAVFVTGAASGIGQSCVNLLAANGYTVFAGVHRPMALDSWAPSPDSGRIIPIVLDIRFDEDVRQAFDAISRQLSDLDLIGVVNCAGVSFPGPLERVEPSEMLDMLNINVVGQLRVVQAYLQLLHASNGRIVMIGSTSGIIPGVFTGAYSASKFALAGITDVLRAELAANRIGVSIVDPGMIGTPFWEKTIDRVATLLAHPRNGHLNNGTDAALAGWQQRIVKLADNAADPGLVARCVLHALTAKRPQTRYIVGTKAKLKLLIWKFLPEILKDIVIRRSLSGSRSPSEN